MQLLAAETVLLDCFCPTVSLLLHCISFSIFGRVRVSLHLIKIRMTEQ